VLESFASKERDKAAALKFIKKAMKRHGRPRAIVTDGLRAYGAEGDWHCRSPGHGALEKQSSRELTSTVPTTRTGYEPVSEDEDTPEIQLGPRPDP
jgi:transposase-like protein